MMTLMSRNGLWGFITQSGDLLVSNGQPVMVPAGGNQAALKQRFRLDWSESAARKGLFSLLDDAKLAEPSGVSQTHEMILVQVINPAAATLTHCRVIFVMLNRSA